MATEKPSGTPATPLTLVYLDVDDEITSAASRIRYAIADRVALVLPYGSRLATSRINFRLLAREATERGKTIEVISADSSARSLAQAAGLSVYPSVAAFEGRDSPQAGGATAGSEATSGGKGTGGKAAATGASAGTGGDAGATAAAAATGAATGVASAGAAARAVEPDAPFDSDEDQTRTLALPRRKSPRVPTVGPARPPVRTGLAVGAGLGLLALVLVGGLIAVDVLPSATITLHPRSEDIGPLELTVEARPDVAAPDFEALVIPAQQLTFELEASDTFTATGVKVTETKATGNVRFSNFDTGRANRIDAGSIVRTESGIEFVTLATVTLPNATIEFPFTLVPSTSTVGVEAVESGPEGNVGNNSITVVPKGKNRNLLRVTNVEATAGGASTQSPQVSAADVSSAQAAIDAALIAELDRQVAEASGVPAGHTLFPETRAVGTTEYEVDPETLVGTDAADFPLAATAQGTALAVDARPIDAAAEAQLAGRVDTGWSLLPDSIATVVGTPAIVGDFISYPVTISGTQVHDVDEAALIAAVQGLVLAEARSRLDDFGDVEIDLWPDWVTNVPKNPDRITLTLAEPRPSASPAP